MDILDDMGVSKLSAKVFSKVNNSLNNGIENNYCFQTGFLQSDIGLVSQTLCHSKFTLVEPVMRLTFKIPQETVFTHFG